MIRVLLLTVFLVAAGACLAWYSAQSLPDWYEEGTPHADAVAQRLGEQIEQQGVGEFLGSKFADVMRGQLVLNQTEFNALLQASLRSSPDGRGLLQVSDAVHAELNDGRIEFGVILNLDKVARHQAELREPVEKILELLPLLDNSRVAIAVNGRPIARDGNLALAEDLTLKIGSIPISSSFLQRLGLPGFENARASLPLNYMSISSVNITDDEITLRVFPRL